MERKIMKRTEQKRTQTVQEVTSLEQETVAKLHIRYLKAFGEASRSNHKQFLIRRIAWRLQALASGDLSDRARERARLLAEDAELRLTAPAGYFEGRRARRDSRLPAPGTVLRRKFQDQVVSVEVLEKGFQYDGVVYRSLSAVARKITGTQWNGFAFFALDGNWKRR